ncbi:MAG: hypothetical protein HY356_06945 [Gammaproteobacteria bacterium]|nr:hypothetical protein [Gammaproteobacteria bacterium]
MPDGNYQLTEFHQGDTVADLLDYVHIDVKNLEKNYKQKINSANLNSMQQSQYLGELTQGLDGYTYLED